MSIRSTALMLLVLASASAHALGGTLEEQLVRYAAEVRAADSAFSGFSAARGEQFHNARFGTGKPDTPACSTCHGSDPATPGRTLTGKAIEPVALSASPSRYADPEKVEKWFKRNCNEVLGRACSPAEKGDWLAYMQSR
ncbi:MAG TPA: DUF1924 domain-containing protein [Rhodocyclaceae bacterium]|nr:DUF1924 domain-containing protein [Rhodocyclaceae bacterium]HRQ47277.1 DUF1924 domain-containing protein [Rhodocyclaceae bacterium]